MELEKEIEFILFLDALKNVERRNYNLDDRRRENTAEHSWQVVVLAQVLYPYAKNREAVDLLRVLKMLSIHDVVEIKAGDTFIFDEEKMKGKHERELRAARETFGLLEEPLRAEFMALWLEFEAEETPDSIFSNAVDRLMPFILNTHNAGTSWTEAGVTVSQVRKTIAGVVEKASDEMKAVFERLLDKAVAEGKLRE